MNPSKLNKLLLDTHVFLWWRTNSQSLNQTVCDTIADADLVFVSVASAWEAAIKISLGKLRIPEPFEAGVIASGFDKLGIAFTHAETSARLPLHHRDPFDRMLIAQALEEQCTLVTHDQQFRSYEVDILWT